MSPMDDLHPHADHHHGDSGTMSMSERADAAEEAAMHELEELVATRSTLFYLGDGEVKHDTSQAACRR